MHTSSFAWLFAQPSKGTHLLWFPAFGSCEERKRNKKMQKGICFFAQMKLISKSWGSSFPFPFASYLLKMTFNIIIPLFGLFLILIWRKFLHFDFQSNSKNSISILYSMLYIHGSWIQKLEWILLIRIWKMQIILFVCKYI